MIIEEPTPMVVPDRIVDETALGSFSTYIRIALLRIIYDALGRYSHGWALRKLELRGHAPFLRVS